MRKVILATKDPAEGKLAPKWEGPYRVVKTHPKRAYRLETVKDKPLPSHYREHGMPSISRNIISNFHVLRILLFDYMIYEV
jgi:hypothetical protein